MNRRGWLVRQARLLAGVAALPSVGRAGVDESPRNAPDRTASIPHFPPGPWPRRRLVTSDGVALSLIDTGPVAGGQDAAPWFLLPGWCMPASLFGAQIDALSARWRVVAIDPRGQGESAVPKGGYTLDRRVQDLGEALGRLPRPPIVLAWSLGVMEILAWLGQYPPDRQAQLLAGLVLVDNSVGEPPAPRGSDFLQRLRKNREPTVTGFVHAMFNRPLPEPELAALAASVLQMPLEGSIALLSYPVPRERYRDWARAFPGPLCYMVTPQFAAQAESLAAHRPGTRTELFTDAGHALFVDQAARCNAILTDFGQGIG